MECEESVKHEQLPKIVLQQLVENSIQHGYNNSKNIMKIHVHGWRDETGWYFEVRDNGQGTTEEVREGVKRKNEKNPEKDHVQGKQYRDGNRRYGAGEYLCQNVPSVQWKSSIPDKKS